MDDYVSKRVAAIEDEQEGCNAIQQPKLQGVASGDGHKLAGLRCQEKYGGPDDEYAEREMSFWSDIPSDESYKSPFMDETERFLAFEPDHGGWNNIRSEFVGVVCVYIVHMHLKCSHVHFFLHE